MDLTRRQLLTMGALGAGFLLAPSGIWAPLRREAHAQQAVNAFPSAQGFGANAVGGRGGAALFVTNLNDDGPGSLRVAARTSGPRTIIFRVGGTINLESNINVIDPFYTIAGQTAPGQGIQLKNYGLNLMASHGIVRFLRARVGHDRINLPPAGTVLGDQSTDPWGRNTNAINVLAGSSGAVLTHDVIVDHCETCWATDTQLDAYGNVTDVTFQNCLMGEGTFGLDTDVANPHGNISLLGTEPFHSLMRFSMLRNLYLHGFGRMPVLLPYAHRTVRQLAAQLDLRNNLIYNWAGSSQTIFTFASVDSTQFSLYWNAFYSNPAANAAVQVNMIGNHSRSGPMVNSTPAGCWVTAGARLYARNNITPGSATPRDGFAMVVHRTDAQIGYTGYPPGYVSEHTAHGSYSITPYQEPTEFNFYGSAYPAGTTLTATEVFESVLQNVGCQKVVRNGVVTSIRDALTLRQTNDVRNLVNWIPLTLARWQSGERLPYPTIAGGTAPVDSDNDGIPDDWAIAHGLNPTGNPGPQTAANGYTHLENYINELAGDLVVPTDPGLKRFAPVFNLRRASWQP